MMPLRVTVPGATRLQERTVVNEYLVVASFTDAFGHVITAESAVEVVVQTHEVELSQTARSVVVEQSLQNEVAGAGLLPGGLLDAELAQRGAWVRTWQKRLEGLLNPPLPPIPPRPPIE